MADHLAENTIQAFVEGDASDAEAARVEHHIDDCPDCRRKLAELSRAVAPPHPDTTKKSAGVERWDAGMLRAGARVGRYTVMHAIGAGAMGIVYAAYDPDLDRKIALKLVRTGEGASGGQTRTRVLREAKAIARLAHPNVVAVHDVGTFLEDVFIAMELVEGGTLRWTIDGQRRPWRETLALFLQAGAGLEAAHAAGLVHRDFKPDNVLLGKDGRPRVCDFGLARSVESDQPADDDLPAPDVLVTATTLTQTGVVIGTPAYMSPEQMRGRRADARADVFAFAVALYEALWSERPFSGRTFRELRDEVEAGRLRPAPAKSDVPRWLRERIARGLAARPEDRYASMTEMLAALRDEPSRARMIGAIAIGLLLLAVALLYARCRVS